MHKPQSRPLSFHSRLMSFRTHSDMRFMDKPSEKVPANAGSLQSKPRLFACTLRFLTFCAIGIATYKACYPAAPSMRLGSVINLASLDEAPFCGGLHAASKSSKEASTVINRPLMVYVGSSSIKQPGFISLPQDQLDVTKASDFTRWFCLSSVDTFLTEHTFEHIPEDLHERAFHFMHKYLKPGGRLRIAVPVYLDGHSASPLDVKYGHVAFVTRARLAASLRGAGFNKIQYLEHRESDVAYTQPYDSCDGRIRRSTRHDDRNRLWLKNNIASLNITEHNDVGSNTIRPPPPLMSTILDAIKDK